MRAIPERLRDVSSGGAIQIDDIYVFYLYSVSQAADTSSVRTRMAYHRRRWSVRVQNTFDPCYAPPLIGGALSDDFV